MKKLIKLWSFVLWGFYACNTVKPVATPEIKVPFTFRNEAQPVNSTSIAHLAYRDFIVDSTLKSLIDSAMRRNYDLLIAIKNIESSQIALKQIKWNYVPELSLNITASSNRPSNNSLTGLSLSQYKITSNHIEDYSANLYLTWEADIWRKIRQQKSAALSSYLQTEEAKKAIQTSLVAEISKGYYNLLALIEQRNVANKNVKLEDSTLSIIRLQYTAGQVSSLAVQQAEAQKWVAMQLIPQYEQNITLQENVLKMLTGAFPEKIEGLPLLNQVSVFEQIPAGYPSTMVRNRPDVLQAEWALSEANAQVGIAKANQYPSLKITATSGLNSFMASNWFTVPSSLFGTVTGGLIEPIFNHKLLKTQYLQSKVNREKAVLYFRKSVLTAVEEVSNALIQIEKLKEQQKISEQRVQTLQKATQNAHLLFKNGLANYLEVITAQSNVLQSELDLASIKRDELTAVSELYRALGGGWK